MEVTVLKNVSGKAGGYRVGQVLDLPEETIASLPGFFRAVGEERALAEQKQLHRAEKMQAAHTDRVAHKVAMARDEAERKAGEADLLMEEAAHRLKLAEEAKRQAQEAAERADALALHASPTDPAPPHKRNRRAE